MSPINLHVHPPYPGFYEHPAMKEAIAYFRTKTLPSNMEEALSVFKKCGISKSILLPLECETVVFTELIRGEKIIPNEYCAQLTRTYPDKLASFACVDPHRGREAVEDFEKYVKDFGFIGLKTHAALQAFYPNDSMVYPFYEKCVELDVPALFHCGTTGLYYTRMKYTRPLYLDDVAIDFPKLKIICAHFGWPWIDECLALAVRHPNVFVELSGWYPKYFMPQLVQYMTKVIPQKFLFGSDYPLIDPGRWLDEFNQISMGDDVREMILEKNARKLLRI